MDIARLLVTSKVLHGALAECRQCLRDVEKESLAVIVSPSGTPKEFILTAAPLPAAFSSLQRNLFSTMFQSVYSFLGIPLERRMLYGRINYLFRIWVTSADNLLDGEDKISLGFKMPADSRVMRQVLAIMAADRILARFLRQAVDSGVITAATANVLSDGTLQVLLPSAAEEASEEKGVLKRPPAAYVLSTIHKLKTAQLFHLPLFGPEHIEKKIDKRIWEDCREGLGQFGLGCQVLDDVRDIARDHLEKRHNYILSLMRDDPPAMKRLCQMAPSLSPDTQVFEKFGNVVLPAVKKADQLLREGLFRLDRCGLGVGKAGADILVRWMFTALDVEKARRYLK